MKTRMNVLVKEVVSWCAAVSFLTLVNTTVFAESLNPSNPLVNQSDALDESKVGIAARFIPIKVGEFEMGSPEDDFRNDGDEIQHTVRLTKDFEMQATAVTQLQYFLVMGRNPSLFRQKESCDKNNYQVRFGMSLCINHPIEFVTWDDAQRFVAELNKIQNEYIYRLPTEAEREYAARGGMPFGFPYSFGFNDHGTNEINNYGWYNGNSNSRTHAVALKKANPYGLYDVHGNVWEWVQDLFGTYPSGAVTDPKGPMTNSSYRVARGGSWYKNAGYLRSATRTFFASKTRSSAVGFRLVRTRK